MDNNFNKNLKILGLDYDADMEAIKRAYRELVKIHHPDLFKNPENKEKASKNFKIIKTAYDYLIEEYISPEKRVVEEDYRYKQEFNTYEADVNSELILFLKDCIKNRTRIFMWYESGKFNHNITRRIIVPYELYLGSELNRTGFNPKYRFWDDKIYLIAFCELRMARRTFRLDRILRAEAYEEKINLPSENHTKTEFSEKFEIDNNKTEYFVDRSSVREQVADENLQEQKYESNDDFNSSVKKHKKNIKYYIGIFVTSLFLIFILLVITELFFAVLQVNRSFFVPFENLTKREKIMKIFSRDYLRAVYEKINYYYFSVDWNSYIELDEFRKPATGVEYKDKNILLAGCSFSYGDGLPFSDTFGSVLAEFYPKYKVFNVSLCGASPREFLYILRNFEQYKNYDFFPESTDETKFIIYTYIPDQKRRLINNVYRISPKYKIRKTNGNKELVFYKPIVPVQKSFIYRYYEFRFNPKRLPNKLFSLYLREIKNETDRIFPNAQFILLRYSNYENDLDIKTLEQMGIKVFEIKENELYSDLKYTTDGWHPNRFAWERIVPMLGKTFDF